MVKDLSQGYVNLIKDINKKIKMGKRRKTASEEFLMQKKEMSKLGRSVQAQVDASSPRPMKTPVIGIKYDVRRLTD